MLAIWKEAEGCGPGGRIFPPRYAWPLGEAFSNPDIKGGVRTDHGAVAGLTREERTILIRAIDMGGQYYSRQNSAFQPYALDPLSR